VVRPRPCKGPRVGGSIPSLATTSQYHPDRNCHPEHREGPAFSPLACPPPPSAVRSRLRTPHPSRPSFRPNGSESPSYLSLLPPQENPCQPPKPSQNPSTPSIQKTNLLKIVGILVSPTLL